MRERKEEREEMKRKRVSRRPPVKMQIEQMISKVRNWYFSPVLFEERNECLSLMAQSGRERVFMSLTEEVCTDERNMAFRFLPQCLLHRRLRESERMGRFEY